MRWSSRDDRYGKTHIARPLRPPVAIAFHIANNLAWYGLDMALRETERDMSEHDGPYILHAPTEPLHDVFVRAGVDSGDYRAVILKKGKGLWSFSILRNDGSEDVFARSDFFFLSRAKAVEWLEPQVPYID